MGILCRCAGAVTGIEGGIQVLAGLAQSSQTIGSLLRTDRPAKCDFDEFTSIEKYTQLLFIEHIRQSQKFDEPSNYQSSKTLHKILTTISRAVFLVIGDPSMKELRAT